MFSVCGKLLNESHCVTKINAASKFFRCTATLSKPSDSRARSKHGKLKINEEYVNFKFVYPEFLPDPDPNFRNRIREKLERYDMLKRRSRIDIPEFYVGSIMCVKISDQNALGKSNKFVGICTQRRGCGLKAHFILRNVIDNIGVEVRYDVYDPLIQQIQVLRLEKRLDTCLRYLRDAPLEYSTFDFDMEPEILPEGTEVPVNRIQIELNPRPWREKWDRKGYKGIYNIEQHYRERDHWWHQNFETPWEKYDLMKEYRATIPEEDQGEIWTDVYSKLHELDISRRQSARKRIFSFPKKRG